MEDSNKIVSSEKALNNRKDVKKESTKPTVVKKVITEDKKPATPAGTPPIPFVTTKVLTAEAESGKAKNSAGKNVEKKQKTEGEKVVQNELASIENRVKVEPDKKQKEKIKVVKKNAKKAEEKVDKLKKKVKKAKKKDVKTSKIKALKEKLGKALDKLKAKLKKLKKSKK